MELLYWVLALVILAFPLVHGLATLRGMKRKALYPLLRSRGKGGRMTTVKVQG